MLGQQNIRKRKHKRWKSRKLNWKLQSYISRTYMRSSESVMCEEMRSNFCNYLISRCLSLSFHSCISFSLSMGKGEVFSCVATCNPKVHNAYSSRKFSFFSQISMVSVIFYFSLNSTFFFERKKSAHEFH